MSCHYDIVRTILDYPKSESYETLQLKTADIKSLEKRREFQVILYRSFYSQGPTYNSNFFNLENVQYNLRGISTCLELPSFYLEWM